MNKSQLLNLNKNSKQNVKQIFKVQIEEETTNSNTIINNPAQIDDSKEYNEKLFDGMESLLNKKRVKPDNDSDVIENNIPAINTNYGNVPKQNDKIEENVETKKTPRMLYFDDAKLCIFKSCMENIDSLKENIFHCLDLSEFKLNSTIKDKLGKNQIEHKLFFQKLIKEIYCNSTQKNTKDKKRDKHNKEAILNDILDQEKKDYTIKIKILNALFNLSYYDFLYAYLNDFTYIIFKNNSNGETVVDFCQSTKGYSFRDCLIFDFITYKNCFIGKYDEEHKERFKQRILEMILGLLKKKK